MRLGILDNSLNEEIVMVEVIHDIRLPVHRKIGNCYYVEWGDSDVRTMDVIREVLALVDCNPVWSGNYVNDGGLTWLYNLSLNTSLGLMRVNTIRNIYYPHDRKYQVGIDMSVVGKIIKWINEAYDISIHEIGKKNRIEQSPACPGCGHYLELSWQRFSNVTPNSYMLLWKCPIYSSYCRTTIAREWPSKMPPLVYTKNYKTYFHNWEYDKTPIPASESVGPSTEWGILAGKHDFIAEVRKEDNLSKITTTKFTDGELQTIRDTYEEEGAAGYFRKYPHTSRTWYSVQAKAYQLGIRDQSGSRKKNKRKE